MNSFQVETKHWRRNEMTDQNYQDIERIIADKELLELAASCLALEEDFFELNDHKSRIKEILAMPKMHLESALYLVYHNAVSKGKAARLYKELHIKYLHKIAAKYT